MYRVDPKKLEALRTEKGKKQGEVAKLIGISQSAYSVREKTGNFDTNEVDIICKFLAVTKEQIGVGEERTNVEEIDFLVTKAIQSESMLTVLLESIAEVMAKLNNGSATRISADLKAAANSLSKATLDELRP